MSGLSNGTIKIMQASALNAELVKKFVRNIFPSEKISSKLQRLSENKSIVTFKQLLDAHIDAEEFFLIYFRLTKKKLANDLVFVYNMRRSQCKEIWRAFIVRFFTLRESEGRLILDISLLEEWAPVHSFAL